jgi:hypothetical protein
MKKRSSTSKDLYPPQVFFCKVNQTCPADQGGIYILEQPPTVLSGTLPLLP